MFPMNVSSLWKAAIAAFGPILAFAIFHAGTRFEYTNNRVFDAAVAAPLFVGTYFGIAAFRTRTAPATVRGFGLLAAVLSAPCGVMLLFVTTFGLR